MKYNATQYYYDGYAAQTNGLAYEHCQIEIGTHARLDWFRGWRDAERDNRKKSSPSEIDSSNKQFESLATKEDEAWRGDGLPPVGAECEWLVVDHNWIGVKVLAYHDDEAWLQPLNGAKSFTVGGPGDFRPIRTEAERKREEAEGAMRLCLKGTGYGMMQGAAKIVFDAIAAGKIPNIKLECAHE